MRATLNDTLHFIRAVSKRAQNVGYLLAPYGSTILSGAGRDIDVLAVPWRPPNDYRYLLTVLATAGYPAVGGHHFGAMGTCAVLLRCPATSALIDLQIREVERSEHTLLQIRRVLETDQAGML